MFFGEANGNTFFITETKDEFCKALSQKEEVDSVLHIEMQTYESYVMKIIEKDGTESDMCGNGVIVVSQIIFDRHSTNEAYIQTKSGTIKTRKERNGYISVKMSSFCFLNEHKINNQNLYLTSVGEPHAIFLGNPYEFDKCYDIVNKKIKCSENFTTTFNLNFVLDISGNSISVSTFERGVNNFTKSCGTGSFCIANTLNLLGITHDKLLEIKSIGGITNVDLNEGTISARPKYYQI